MGLLGWLGVGVLALECHTPSTLTPFSNALMPKGTCVARPRFTLAECRSSRFKARVSALILAYFRILHVL